MDDREKNTPQETSDYVPSSIGRRILAWVGLAYMVILVLLNFYALMTGQWIRGVAPLMLCPAVVGLAVVTIHKCRAGTMRGGIPATVFIVALCAVALAAGLYTGIPALLGNLGGS